MSRKQLEDEILYQIRHLNELKAIKTNCYSCGRKKYEGNVCMLHGQIPPGFMTNEDCPDWEFELIPF